MKKRWTRGESFRCPACGRDSVVQCRPVMEGWTRRGEEYVCALCSHSLGPVENESEDSDAADADSGVNALAAFLGQDRPDDGRPRLDPDGDAVFCRDCRHYLRHPFKSRCLLHDRPTEPMDDCADYEAAADEENESDRGNA